MRRSLLICFYDLKSSTTLQQRDEELAGYLQIHLAQVARDLVSRWNGKFLKAMGDGGMVVFPDEWRGAFEFCQGLIRHFQLEPALKDLGVAIRMSLVHGSAIVFDADPLDVFGINVSRAKRLCDVASGGEVLIDSSVVDTMAEADHARWIGRSTELELSGFNRPTRAYLLSDGSPGGAGPRNRKVRRSRVQIDSNCLAEVLRRHPFSLQRGRAPVGSLSAGPMSHGRGYEPKRTLLLADAAQLCGQLEHAREIVMPMVRELKRTSADNVLLAYAYHLLGIIRGAQNYHELALCYYDLAITTLGSSRAGLRLALIHRDRSIALGKLGLFKDALQAVNDSIRTLYGLHRTHPKNTSPRAELAISLFRLGHLYAKQDRYNSAAREYRAALDYLPASEVYHKRRATILVHLAAAEFRRSETRRPIFEQYLKQALELSNEHGYHNRLAEISFLNFEQAFQLGNYDIARSHLRAAVLHAARYDQSKALETADLIAKLRMRQPPDKADSLQELANHVATQFERTKRHHLHLVSEALRTAASGDPRNWKR